MIRYTLALDCSLCWSHRQHARARHSECVTKTCRTCSVGRCMSDEALPKWCLSWLLFPITFLVTVLTSEIICIPPGLGLHCLQPVLKADRVPALVRTSKIVAMAQTLPNSWTVSTTIVGSTLRYYGLNACMLRPLAATPCCQHCQSHVRQPLPWATRQLVAQSLEH